MNEKARRQYVGGLSLSKKLFDRLNTFSNFSKFKKVVD